MDCNELWEKATVALQKDMNYISYSTFIENNLIPVRIEGDTLVLRIMMEQLKSMIINRYQDLIDNCLTQCAGRSMKCLIKGQSEIEEEEKAAQPQEEPSSGPQIVQLNPFYTFDTFVVGSGNRFAHAAAVAVAQQPSEVYNPLFIYGDVGLGKTHLMHAIGHYVQEEFPQKKLLYITSETFMNELIAAIQQGRNMEFRNRFRTVDILMVDDIQFIAGKDSTQEEFFHTFNELHNAGKQIILTSDKPPQEITRLEERLRSRFAGGLITDIKKPDVETRIAILKSKASREGVTCPDEVFTLIAEHVASNIRELEGSFNRLVAYAQLMGEPITLELCQAALSDILKEHAQRHVVNVEAVIKTVSGYFNLKPTDITGSARRRDIMVPRQIAIYLTRELTQMSLPQIGVAFGNRDHSTILHSINQITRSIVESSEVSNQVNDLRQMVLDI